MHAREAAGARRTTPLRRFSDGVCARKDAPPQPLTHLYTILFAVRLDGDCHLLLLEGCGGLSCFDVAWSMALPIDTAACRNDFRPLESVRLQEGYAQLVAILLGDGSASAVSRMGQAAADHGFRRPRQLIGDRTWACALCLGSIIACMTFHSCC
jgi:hypothetical protein